MDFEFVLGASKGVVGGFFWNSSNFTSNSLTNFGVKYTFDNVTKE